MRQHTITENLSFIESPPQGATLQWVCTEGDVVDVFAVNMSWKSLEACHRALSRSKVSWEMKDGSLRIHGTIDKVELTFRMAGPPSDYRRLILQGEALANFKGTLDLFKTS